MEDGSTQEVVLAVRWAGKLFPVELSAACTVGDLKHLLFSLTEVLPERQKLMGLSKRGVDDSTVLSTLKLKLDQKVMLVGSLEADIQSVAGRGGALPDVMNDLDFDYSKEPLGSSAESESLHEANLMKLNRRVAEIDIRIMNPLRADKRLLVLDLDYTLFDCKGTATRVSDLGRPGLHEFLASAYVDFDLVIWSQTSWRWLEAKITELGMVFHQDYKLAFVLDAMSMFSITARKNGAIVAHQVKALEIIWRKFPERYNVRNTVHIDDLSRNFALNPQSGLKISQYKNAATLRATDRELFELKDYLKLIALREPDFTKLRHKDWKLYLATHRGELPQRTA